MTYQYQGSDIEVTHPVNSISINQRKVIFADKQGNKRQLFANKTDARRFLAWLIKG